MKHFWLIVIMLCINLSCSNDLLFVTGTTNYIFRDLAYDVNRYVKLLTDKAIREGLRKLEDGSKYDNLYLAAKARSESD